MGPARYVRSGQTLKCSEYDHETPKGLRAHQLRLLGYTFQGPPAKGRRGFFINFSPAMSVHAKKVKGKQIKD
jgi:hypothetical protein